MVADMPNRRNGSSSNQSVDLSKIFAARKPAIPGFMPTPSTTYSRPGPLAPSLSDSNAIHAAQILEAQRGMSPPAPVQTYSGQPNSVWQGDQGMMEQRKAGLTAQAAVPLVPIDYNASLYGTPSTSGSGSRSGSRSAAPSLVNPDPLGWNAIAQVQAVDNAYKSMLDALKASQATQMGSYDRSTAAVNAGTEASRARQAQIISDLSKASQEAGGRVGDVYKNAGQSLQDLMSKYAASANNQNQSSGQTLAAFGADPRLAVPGGSSPSDYLAANAANLISNGAISQGQLAGRGDIYGALGQDFAQRSDAWSQQQLAQIIAQRQQAEAAAAKEQAQLALDLEMKKLALQQQEQARQAAYNKGR
jgi:hypothetical protein